MKPQTLILTLLAVTMCAGAAMAQTGRESVSTSKQLIIQPSFSAYAKTYVEKRINEWQKKGEFERTDAWQARVNEQTRRQKIHDLTAEAEKIFIATLSGTVQMKLTLNSYDADNEVYLITDAGFGNMLVPVPLSDAPGFKQAWSSLQTTPEYFIENDHLALAELTFKQPGSTAVYRYSNKASLNYSVADVDYNFDPIEINLADNSGSKGRQNISTVNITVGKSDVDVDIPQTTRKNDKTFAVIIANEKYTKLSHVPYALNDGKMFGEYCRKTLGIPATNIRAYNDATYGEMLAAMKDIRKIADAYQGNIKVLFYYAGHGAPNESTKDAYLLPVDAYGVQSEVCYPLARLYRELEALNCQSVTVFLDACFSGAARDNTGEMLANARGVSIKANTDTPSGNLIVFSAASEDETALPYADKGHGLFTYFLLKKLQETKGDVTFGELGDYIKTQVVQLSNVINRKDQTPTIAPSLSFAKGWRTLKL